MSLPVQFRRALRRPQPAERDYLAAQYTGTGLQIGSKAPAGGWLVVGPLAGSAAEHGGILPGERLLEISKPDSLLHASNKECCLCEGTCIVDSFSDRFGFPDVSFLHTVSL